MKEGEWVYGPLKKGSEYYFRGYVMNVGDYASRIKCTYPAKIDEIIVPNSELKSYASTSMHLNDIPALIDLALMTGDKIWFDELQNELYLYEISKEFFS